ncbi:hypothetical protein EVAR_54658_1 [Eumeta japonica]|uniref:Uncharacterized protein n=1 Tax=Eumeta variegata TaxID=151549 RepID=A0A4C1X7T1_EUMVA|nr:hypothetical protein EVAR_54658_1 [Eumeta japonica]
MSVNASARAVRGTRTTSLDQLDFQERRQLIASSLSLTDFLHAGAKEVAAVAVSERSSGPLTLHRPIPLHHSTFPSLSHSSLIITFSSPSDIVFIPKRPAMHWRLLCDSQCP